ncbi:uncharacterized protein LOC135498918 [Lineus longissimus]|uniref:uncharacterized protein LOC135498918 n=1 Tax=Lineus longissimus TaxID=88925 RepID=UPI00315D3B7D
MAGIKLYRTVFLLCSVALLDATKCPSGTNYPEFCPRLGDKADLTTCCLTSDNKPDCCKTPASVRKVTICPQGYITPQCPGKNDPDELNICCRFVKNIVASDACCSSSWVMTDGAKLGRIDSSSSLEEDVAYWRTGVIVLGVLFSLALISAISGWMAWCCACSCIGDNDE